MTSSIRLDVAGRSWLRWPAVAMVAVVWAWAEPNSGGAVVLGFWLTGAVVLFRARRQMVSTGSRRAWGFFVLTGGVAVSASVVRLIHGLIIGVEFPLPSPLADALACLAYAFFATAQQLFVRYRSAGRDLDAWLDSAILAVSVGFLLWVGFMSPYAVDPSHPLDERIVNSVYFAIQVGLLASTVRLLVAPGIRSASYHLLAGGTAVLVLADLAGSVAYAKGLDAFSFVVLNTLAWGFVVAAGRHPGVEQLTATPDDIAPRDEGRLWSWSWVSLALPTTILVASGPLSTARKIEATVGAVALLGLVGFRGLRLISSRAWLLGRSSDLVSIADEMNGKSEAELDKLVLDGSRAMLLATPVFLGLVDGSEHTVENNTVENNTADNNTVEDARVTASDMPADLASRLQGEDEIRATVPEGRLFAIPAAHKDAWLAVVSSQVLSRHERLALRSLSRSWSAAHIAAESATLAAAHLAERQWTKALVESEKRQRALLKNSGGITAILAEDQTIDYISHPVVSILGFSTVVGAGTQLSQFISDGESLARWRTAWQRCIETGSATDELRFKHRDGSDRILEVILNDHRRSEVIDGVVLNARDISETRRLEEQVGRDHVTLALNRKAFLAFLAEHEQVEVMTIAVEDWGLLSRAISTEQADLMLQTIADRLRQSLRFGDKLARLEGATFAVALLSTPPMPTEAIASRLGSAVTQPITTGDRTLSLDARIGHAEQEANPTDMLEHAMAALAQASPNQVGAFETYRPTFDGDYELELELDMWSRMGDALDAGEFELHYQPIVELRSVVVTSAEALLRWRHPTRGMIPPNDFVPIAERHPALMTKLGDWIIDAAAAQAGAWLRAGLIDQTFSISVNISGAQIQPQLVDTFATAVKRHGISAKMLAVEATETLLSESADLEASVLANLRRAGHILAVDDFGTGTSNLAKLGSLRPDIVKIDRSLLIPIETDDAALQFLEKSVEMIHTVGSQVTIEGVETVGQATIVRDLGCEHAQGYFFARPAPPSDQTLEIVSTIES